MVRVLASSNVARVQFPARRHMWVEFVVGSRPCSEAFSLGPQVSSLH